MQSMIGEQGAALWINWPMDFMTSIIAGADIVLYTAEGGEKAAHPSPILYALAFVDAMALLTGFGDPHQENDLKKGAQQLTELREQLEGAFPNSTWQSAASQTYASRVAARQDAAADLVQHDQDLAELIQRGAEYVIHLRLIFGLLKAVLLVAVTYEVLYFLEGDIWDGTRFADQAAALGVTVAIAIMTAFGILAIVLADSANHIAHGYQNVGKSGVGVDIGTLMPTPLATAANQRELRTADTDNGEIRAPNPGIRAGSHLGAAPEPSFSPMPAPMPTTSAATAIGPTRMPAMSAPAAPPRRPTAAGSLAERPAPRTATSAQPGQDTGERAPFEAAALHPEQAARPQPALAID